jgi:hypothetical protein
MQNVYVLCVCVCARTLECGPAAVDDADRRLQFRHYHQGPGIS